MNVKEMTAFIKNPALVFSIVALLFIFLVFIFLITFFLEPALPSTTEMRRNEENAFIVLNKIKNAQDEYRSKDPDKDGKKAYAPFFTHLWQSISETSENIPVNLISKDLAFAMGSSREREGYYFMDIHFRFDDQGKAVQLDPENEWALTGVPARIGLTGKLIFLINQRGIVYAKTGYEAPKVFPFDPRGEGWVVVKEKADVRGIGKGP
jgi:predicted SnoaL-like aldol condensation-catalyzing enzyme